MSLIKVAPLLGAKTTLWPDKNGIDLGVIDFINKRRSKITQEAIGIIAQKMLDIRHYLYRHQITSATLFARMDQNLLQST